MFELFGICHQVIASYRAEEKDIENDEAIVMENNKRLMKTLSSLMEDQNQSLK